MGPPVWHPGLTDSDRTVHQRLEVVSRPTATAVGGRLATAVIEVAADGSFDPLVEGCEAERPALTAT